MVELDAAIRSFYRDRYVEDDRLSRSGHGQLEFWRTQELLRRLLPVPPATILDVGGATGVHARWLAADGYSVTLVDPVVEHVEKAAAVGTFAAVVGDARQLEQEDDSVDVTLLLGPLYHLVEAADRAQALAEAARVTRPGGVVVAAGISRYAGLLEYGNNGYLRRATFTCSRTPSRPAGTTTTPRGSRTRTSTMRRSCARNSTARASPTSQCWVSKAQQLRVSTTPPSTRFPACSRPRSSSPACWRPTP